MRAQGETGGGQTSKLNSPLRPSVLRRPSSPPSFPPRILFVPPQTLRHELRRHPWLCLPYLAECVRPSESSITSDLPTPSSPAIGRVASPLTILSLSLPEQEDLRSRARPKSYSGDDAYIVQLYKVQSGKMTCSGIKSRLLRLLRHHHRPHRELKSGPSDPLTPGQRAIYSDEETQESSAPETGRLHPGKVR